MKPSSITTEFNSGQGILRLRPAWVTMNFNRAGGRLRLHPDDWYPKGVSAGAVKERWMSSTLMPRKGSDEGLSYVEASQGEPIPFPEAIQVLGTDLIGGEYYQTFNSWPVHAKFFDNFEPLFLHIHLDERTAARLGQKGKPEAYYFPIQLNNHPGTRPATYFGLAPDVTREAFVNCLQGWEKGDTRILDLSRAYRLEPGTGWYTPPGTLHAPGSLLTYEVQWNSASGAVFENITDNGETYRPDGIWRALPAELQGDWNAVLELIDWNVNTDPDYRKHYFRPPIAIEPINAQYSEKWIIYDNPYFAAKELSVPPLQKVVVKDEHAYGCVVVQGHGKIGPHPAEVPGLLRYGQPSADEFFVSEAAAKAGVPIENHSPVEPIVMLKHFGPGVK